MVDVQVEADTVQIETGSDPDETFTVKLKGEAGEVSINTGDITSNETYRAIFQAGLEALIYKANGAAKAITGVTKLEGAELAARQKEIREAAEKTIQNLKDGIVPGAKKAKTSGAVQTEAMRLAKNMVKDLIRASNQRIGAYSAKELTAAAKEVLARTPRLLVLAKENLDARATEAKTTKGLDLKGLFGAKAESADVKAKPKKAPQRKAKGETISAKQAGMVAPRQKPGQHATH